VKAQEPDRRQPVTPAVPHRSSVMRFRIKGQRQSPSDLKAIPEPSFPIAKRLGGKGLKRRAGRPSPSGTVTHSAIFGEEPGVALTGHRSSSDILLRHHPAVRVFPIALNRAGEATDSAPFRFRSMTVLRRKPLYICIYICKSIWYDESEDRRF